jgi:hypothetical protein
MSSNVKQDVELTSLQGNRSFQVDFTTDSHLSCHTNDLSPKPSKATVEPVFA